MSRGSASASRERPAERIRATVRLSGLVATAAAVLIPAFALSGCVVGEDQEQVERQNTDSAAASNAAGQPQGTDTPGGSASQDGSTPADEREASPVAVMGSEWTAADTNEGRSVAGAALLRGLRTARHDGFDRIVLDFGAEAVPGYRISYIDSPVRQCGSGNEVSMAGDGWLSITVEPANAHTEEGEPTIRDRERAPGLPALLELKMICDFEAMVEIVAGVTSPERYRAFVLASPNRLVVDIMHPD